MKKQYKITLFTLLLSISLYGQIERFTFSINAGDSYSLLNNNIPEALSKGKNGYTANLQFNTAISHSLGIGIGLSYANYASDVTLAKYYSSTTFTDTEGEVYE